MREHEAIGNDEKVRFTGRIDHVPSGKITRFEPAIADQILREAGSSEEHAGQCQPCRPTPAQHSEALHTTNQRLRHFPSSFKLRVDYRRSYRRCTRLGTTGKSESFVSTS